ncbi:MAG: VWA domain-containing protein [Candidatus Brocadiia bacterium]
MRFLHPGYLPLAFLTAVPVALYLFRRKPRRVRVSTLLFFKSLAREHQESTWLRRLKRLLSLLLTLVVLVGVVGALAQPVVAPPAGSVRSVVLLVDRSASMAARDAEGRTRMDVVLGRVGERLEGLPSGVQVMVIAYDRRPEILQPFSLDRREVERALRRVAVRPIEGDPQTALRLAARLAALDPPAAVWHATDAAGGTQETGREPPVDLPEGVDLAAVEAALEEPVNAGITAFALRRLPMEPSRFEAFVQLHCSAPEPLEVKMEVVVDGALQSIRRVTVDPRGRERLLLDIEGGQGSVLSLKLAAEGDAMPLDDVVHARVPEVRPIRVVWISPEPDPFTALALASLGSGDGVHVFQGGPGDWPPAGGVDVAVFDGWLPEPWPVEGSVIVVDPPGGAGPLRAAPIEGGLPVDSVRVVEPRHPVLYGVASERVALTQTAVLSGQGTLSPLWSGPSGPVLLAGELRGQRIVVLAFAPELSQRLPLMASYPLLVGNAVYWSVQANLDAAGGSSRRTGDLVASTGSTVAWTVPAEGEAHTTERRLHGRWMELDRVGLWETDAGERGSAALLSEWETRLASGRSMTAAAVEPSRGQGWSMLRGDLRRLLVWCVLAVLVVESWLFHRHAVY